MAESEHPIILSRVPFRISLGGGSTDLPSYYEKYGGFIFAATINLYMDVLIKQTRSDDHIHVHYKQFESVPSVTEVQHELARETLKMTGVERGVGISFKADTPAGTGLGSSGACSVALLKGLSQFSGQDLANEEAAAQSFTITQNLGLPDGKQDPYACALGGFTMFEIAPDGRVKITKPNLSQQTIDNFFANTLFYYTGIQRFSAPILAAQSVEKVLELKHTTKRIGQDIYQAFLKGNLDDFGLLMDEHWENKKRMSPQMSNPFFDQIYDKARSAGALGGKIMGAGAGGYFMIYCGSPSKTEAVKEALKSFNLREMAFRLDTKGARTAVIDW